MRKLLFGIISLGLLCSTTSYADLNSQFEAIQSNQAELRAFLQAFPKGGDLHMHLSGSVTAEAMITMASDHNLFLDKDNWTLVNHTCKNCIAAKGITHDYALYFDTINHWSLRGASSHSWLLNHLKSNRITSYYSAAKIEKLIEATNKVIKPNDDDQLSTSILEILAKAG